MTARLRCPGCLFAALAISAALHLALAGTLLWSGLWPAPNDPGDLELGVSLAMFVDLGAPDGGEAAPVPADPVQQEPVAEPEPPEPVEPEPEPEPVEPEPEPEPVEPEPEPEPLPEQIEEAVPTPIPEPIPEAVPEPAPKVAPPTPVPKAKPAPKPVVKAKPKPKPKAKPKAKPKPKRKPKPKQAAMRSKPKKSAHAKTAKAKSAAAASAGGSAKGGTGSSGKAGSAARAAAEGAYLRGLQQAIGRNRFYPPGARREGLKGVVTVAFTVQGDGRLSDIRVAKGSGHSTLDQAALETLRRLGRYKPIPSATGRSRWPVRVPIVFDLR